MPRSPAAKRIILLSVLTLLLSACGLQANWHAIYSVDLSPDGRALTITLAISPRKENGKFCEQITDKTVDQSPQKVVIGIKVRDACWSIFGERDGHFADAYLYRTTVPLKFPLGNAKMIDRATGMILDRQAPRRVR